MPRTKLDRFTISKTEIETRVIKAAMARNGFFTNKSLADKLDTDSAYLSRGFKSGFSDKMKKRMHKVLHFNQEEIEVIGGWS